MKPLRCLAVILWSGATLASAAPFRMAFLEESDLCEARGVRLAAHGFVREASRVLLPSDPSRPSLWFAPVAAIPSEEGVRLYYQRIDKTLEPYADQRALCVGILKPDFEFALPDLSLYSHSWGGPGNTVLQRSPHKPTWGGFNVFQILQEGPVLYRMLYWDQPEQGEAGGMVADSTDGLSWRKRDETRAVFTEHNDAFSLVYSQELREYLLYQTFLEDWPDKPVEDNLPKWRRAISIRHSKDLVTWSAQEPILVPDAQDAPTCEFYLMKVFPFAGHYLGLLMKYYGDPLNPKKHSALYRYELVVSRDGLAWQRPYRETDAGTWTYADPFDYQGKTWVAAYDKAGLCLFPIRRGGYVSCGAHDAGSFLTHPFTVPSGTLRLNAECQEGSIEIEVVDARGLPLPGLEGICAALSGADGIDLPVAWKGGVSPPPGQEVRLRLTLKNARVYSLHAGE